MDHHYNALLTLCISCLVQTVNGIHTSSSTVATTPPRVLTKLKSLSWDVYCRLQANGYVCSRYGGTKKKWYFDVQLNSCDTFVYGNCKDSYNMFDDRRDCIQRCESEIHKPLPRNLTENIFCLLQPEFGMCNSYHPMYYFDLTDFQCKGFSYSGCGGNNNRFPTAQMCAARCNDVIRALEGL